MAGPVRGDLSCNGTWQYYAAPRIAAGGPLRQDVVKCRTKPLSQADYGVIAFNDDQWARLQAAFPTGVCDYSRSGVWQQPPKARWLTFAGGPGGQPLGDAPQSHGPADVLAELASTLEGFDRSRGGPARGGGSGRPDAPRLLNGTSVVEAGAPHRPAAIAWGSRRGVSGRTS